MGYANAVVTLRFDELSEDPENDPIWVAIRNPRILPPDTLRPRDIPLDEEGKPLNEADAMSAMYVTMANLIIGWRVYDASAVEVDEDTGEVVSQTLLPRKPTPDLVAKLPMAIINRVGGEITEALNPQ